MSLLLKLYAYKNVEKGDVKMERKPITTMERLFEALEQYDIEREKGNVIYDGCCGTIKVLYECYLLRKRNSDLYFLYGALYGLCAAGFITKHERVKLSDILFDL